jgi:two-component system, chemotaxis family, protein-glutamate methylesterase/glutaminase
MRRTTTAASVPTPEPGYAASGTSQRDIVVIGASAGGVEALITLFAGFPAELPASVFVVLHMMPGGTSVLPKILDRAGPLPTATAVGGEAIERGRVYVAPPDHHMLLVDETVRLTSGPRENGHRRPSIHCFAAPLGRAAGE